MSGPRYAGRGRSKCRIRNESPTDEGRNRFKRAPRQTSACARRASTLGASPRASGRPLGPGGPPPSPRGPPALTSESAELQREPPTKLRQARAPRCSCGCGSAVGGSARTARRSAGQGGGPGGRAPTTNDARTAFRMHAGMASVDVALPLLYAARRLWPGSCLGGGRLGQRPNAADAALGGGRWGQRQHESIGMPLCDPDQARTQQSSRCPLAPCCSPSHKKFVRTAGPFESCANKSPNSPKSRSKCEIRIWSRRPARSKCRKFESIEAVRYHATR